MAVSKPCLGLFTRHRICFLDAQTCLCARKMQAVGLWHCLEAGKSGRRVMFPILVLFQPSDLPQHSLLLLAQFIEITAFLWYRITSDNCPNLNANAIFWFWRKYFCLHYIRLSCVFCNLQSYHSSFSSIFHVLEHLIDAFLRRSKIVFCQFSGLFSHWRLARQHRFPYCITSFSQVQAEELGASYCY